MRDYGCVSALTGSCISLTATHLPSAARTMGPGCGGRQVDRRQAHAGTGEGTDAVVLAHQGTELSRVQEDHGPAHQLVQQYDLRRCGGQRRVLPRELHSEARYVVRLAEAR